MSEAATYDLVVRGGRIVTADGSRLCDMAVRNGIVAALGENLERGAREIDARGKLVMPGGVDSHCHIEQRSSMGFMNADDFYTATVSAAFGGTTTVIPFCAQHRGDAIPEVLADYHARAKAKAVIDYAFHLIVANPDARTLNTDLPAAIETGIRSFKIYMTYERIRLNDLQILDVMAVARRAGALVMVHAENHDMITWLSARMLRQANTAPRYHGICHTRGSEAEAAQRAVALAELIDVPLLIVHMSTVESIAAVREARARGLKIYGETCPQYMLLTAKDMDRPGLEGAMFCCSPPPRDEMVQEACWQGLADGTLAVCSSDHSPYRYDETGKLPKGEKTTFKEVAMGLPGLELRLPLMFTYGVGSGRLTLEQFVEVTATRHAKLYGIYPRKGTIAVGSDADLVIWDPDKRVRVTHAMLHDNAGYTPYEGRELVGWPETVISRGQIIVSGGALDAERGRGLFIPGDRSEEIAPLGRQVPEMAQLDAWGTPLSLDELGAH